MTIEQLEFKVRAIIRSEKITEKELNKILGQDIGDIIDHLIDCRFIRMNPFNELEWIDE